MDSPLQTHLLSHWVREKQAFTLEEAVKMITCDTATQFGFHDRGLLREGMAADIVVFDPDTVGPRLPEVVTDLPAGAKRLQAEVRRHARHHRQRPGPAARQRADRQLCRVKLAAQRRRAADGVSGARLRREDPPIPVA